MTRLFFMSWLWSLGNPRAQCWDLLSTRWGAPAASSMAEGMSRQCGAGRLAQASLHRAPRIPSRGPHLRTSSRPVHLLKFPPPNTVSMNLRLNWAHRLWGAHLCGTVLGTFFSHGIKAEHETSLTLSSEWCRSPWEVGWGSQILQGAFPTKVLPPGKRATSSQQKPPACSFLGRGSSDVSEKLFAHLL